MKRIIVISDFDGTITEKDSLVEILDNFASPRWHKIAALVKSGRMGTKIGLRKEFALCRITRKEFVDFLNRRITIDAAFKKFLGFCEKNKLKLLIVSGGFTLNIKTIFEKFKIRGVPYYANIITFRDDKVKLKFPYKAKSCKTCSLCKAPFIRRFKRRGGFKTRPYIIYIGDSVTDRCPAKIADLVFAKHHLAEYCKAKGIAYVPYNTFTEIKTHLKNYLVVG